MHACNILFNNIRIYGTILLLLLSIVVFIGVKLVSLSLSLSALYESFSLIPKVNWFGTFSLAVVIVAVVSIYAGAFNPQKLR